MDSAPAETLDTPAAGFALELAGEHLRLLPQRALWWPSAATVFVADVHLGKAETFRALGVPVPAGPTELTLRRLGALVDGCAARRLVVLGDLLHARTAHEPATLSALRAWRRERATLDCVLVRGNHDDRAGDPPHDLDIRVVEAPSPLGPFALCHEPRDDDRSAPGPSRDTSASAPGYRLAGHVHPAVRLHGRGGDTVRLACFRIGADEAVLPAFGEFTGGALQPREGAARLYAIAGERVFEVPRTGR